MNHDPLCPISYSTCIKSPDGKHGLVLEIAEGYYLCDACFRECHCTAIITARSREWHRNGTCWREAEGIKLPPGAVRVFRESGWFWEMP